MKRVAFLLALVSVAGAAAPPTPSPFTLNTRWTLDFRQANTGRSLSRTAFTVVSVEQSAGTTTAFGLVRGDAAFSVVTVMNAQDGTLTVTALLPLAGTPRQIRICAFGTDRPPLRSGLTVTVPASQLGQALGSLRRQWTAVRADRPQSSTLAVLRVAAGTTTDGAICTVRRAL
ncbi:hypothetical protein E7T09_01895 [Deinococcus sp. KSM4-11]|uniref:hypothetical protein n=1 Tax=Deinococcus sp. KSM4-11 TaxID=2568654 RepID=UPI0010A2C2A5|nr:hypothetical protein [Deinococcus sp. KSM4-11]THF88000.1 hypothetical protein E7T09_01895 [Deinococcus sp. KSM4-11]